MHEISIKEEFIKLDSLLKLSGVAATGGQAKMMIGEGLVTVNGEICLQRGKKIRLGDKVQFEDEVIKIVNAG